MAKSVRQIIKIDEDRCNGCGLCVPSCAEGALQIIDGKARLVSDKFCDGLGACLGECPQGALTFETRQADDFDEAAATQHGTAAPPAAAQDHPHTDHHSAHSHTGFVCPSARTIDRRGETPAPRLAHQSIGSELRQWPVKLYLVNPNAPYFENADLLLSADCAPFAYGSMHPDFLRGRILVAGCPKFDDTVQHLEKLTQILCANNVRSITVLKMEVPCCSGLVHMAQAAVASSGKNIPVKTVTISLNGTAGE